MKQRRPPAKRDLTNLVDLRVGLYCRVSLDKTGIEKSVDDQEAVGREWVELVRAQLAGTYRDADRSASRFATKQREDFIRLLGDIEAGKLDAIWFWELSRSQRRLDVFAKLRDLCRDHGVLWVIRDRVYDPNSYADMMTLGMLSVIGENESELIAERVRRGKASSAMAGLPAVKAPYGYRRFKDPRTGRFDRQEPDVWDGDSRPIENSPAWIVREIYDRYAAGGGTIAIMQDLNRRGIPASYGGQWRASSVLKIAKNPAYISRRVHQGEVLEGVRAMWPPLVEEETFWAVQRILSDPKRTTWRAGGVKHLLSMLARCAECGGPLSTQGGGVRKGTGVFDYCCAVKGCAGILETVLDSYVERVIVAWLSDPDVVADLRRGDGGSAVAAQARADAERLRADLAEYRQQAKAGKITAAFYAEIEQDRLKRIGEAEQLAQDAAVPPVLMGNIGPQAKAGWKQLDLAVKRQIIRAVADIRLRPIPRDQRYIGAGRGRKGPRVPVQDRVAWRWLLGPGAERT